MKKRIIIIITLLIISGLICVAYFWLVTTLDWKEESRKKSPEEDIIAFHMQSRSEAGLAPYGDHIVLVPRYKLLGQYYASPVFAGYCGQEFDYQWIDRQTLEISCAAEKIIKQEVSSRGISIKYKIVNKATHNNRLKSDATCVPVPDEKTAIQIAKTDYYEKTREEMDKDHPLQAISKDGVWVVTVSLPPNTVGGGPTTEIDKKTGKILRRYFTQ